MRDVRAHYIKRNEQAKVPSRFVIFDTEAIRERTKKGERQSWSLACATFLEWTKRATVKQSITRYETAMDLWSAVSDFTRVGHRTVVYAHNLNYDLRISCALSLLPRLGWTLRDIRLDGRGSWSKWSRGKATLTLCDSASIFPVSLDILGKTFSMPKLPLPQSTEREKLFERCERDVQILSTAIISYISWMRSGILGNWQMTGASQAWSHWRHSHYTHKVLIHDNEEALKAEREAMYAGRCEAWRWGLYRGRTWYEYDWENSYPRIARDVGLPSRFVGTLTRTDFGNFESLSKRYCILAELEITTDSPCVPTTHDQRIAWPCGPFVSTLWDPEIRLLRENGATFRVRRAWLYKREPILKDWAEWILSSLHNKTAKIEPWQKLILKHWSRALIGRFGMRYRSWEEFGTAPTENVSVSHLLNLDDASQQQLMQVGTQLYISGPLREIDDGCPQITGYIMSEARAKLWHATQRIGMDHCYYMDTDSLIVDIDGHKAIQSAYGIDIFDGLRSKGAYHKLHIYGPRSIICNKKPSVSGMPKGSVKTEQDKWQGEVWRGATESIRLGEHDVVSIRNTEFRLRYNQRRRWFDSSGHTHPYHIGDNGCLSPEYTERIPVRPVGTDDYTSMLSHLAYPEFVPESIRVEPGNGYVRPLPKRVRNRGNEKGRLSRETRRGKPFTGNQTANDRMGKAVVVSHAN
jgi:hypothetical protein